MDVRNVTPFKFKLPIKPWIIIVVIIVLLVGSGLFTSVYTVDETEKAVVLRFGKYLGEYGAGLHAKLPFGIDKAYIVPVKTQTMEFGYRTQQAGIDTTYASNSQNNEMLTGDLNIINVEWSIIYQIVDPQAYLFNVDTPDNTIQDISRSVINRLVGDTAILGVIGGERARIGRLARDQMQEILDSYDMGIEITQVDLQSTTHTTKSVQDAFEDVNVAEQDMNKLINEGKEEYNRIIPKANGDASKILLDAQAYASERVNRAQGDVARFIAIRDEYKKSPAITLERLYIEMAETIYKQAGKISVIDSSLSENTLLLKNLTSAGGAQ